MGFKKILDRLFKPQPFIDNLNDSYKKLHNINEHINVFESFI